MPKQGRQYPRSCSFTTTVEVWQWLVREAEEGDRTLAQQIRRIVNDAHGRWKARKDALGNIGVVREVHVDDGLCERNDGHRGCEYCLPGEWDWIGDGDAAAGEGGGT